jgi:hypothetical protein
VGFYFSGMAFVLDFAENLIRRAMEDPDERDAKFRKHVQLTKAEAEKMKLHWANPVKPFGYWNLDKNNHKFLMDLTLSRLPGRSSPYDEIASASSSSSSSVQR